MLLHHRNRRRAAIAPLATALLPVLLVMVVFMVDTGHIVVTMTELQNAADSAALAGAAKLEIPSGFGPYNQDVAAGNAAANARAEAKKFCALNTGGGVTLQLADADIIVGYQVNPQAAVVPWSTGQPFPNAVQVVVRRDAVLNGPLDLFIGPVIGIPTWSGHATATGTYMQARYDVTGFNTTPNGPNPLILPIGVDVNFVKNFLATGASPDGIVYDQYTALPPSSTMAPPSNVSSGPDNVPELNDVYPNRTSPGNFGLINLNYTNPANNDPAFRNWILNGPSPTDIASFGPNGFQATPSAPTTIKGGPGWKSNLQSDLNAIIGEYRILPIFSSFSGQGSNTYYTIVGFMGVTVVKAQGRGSNEAIAFQPMVVVDPTATSVPGGSSGSISRFVFTTSPVGLSR